MNAPYRLINARPSPYGRKVAIAMLEKGVAFDTVYDEPWADAVETRRFSPLEQLPILLVEGEDPLFDSCLILDWLELRHPSPPLLPRDADQRIAVLRLQTLAERLMEIAQSLIFEGYRPDPSAQAVTRATAKIERGLRALEALLEPRPCRESRDAIDLGLIALATTMTVWEFVVDQKMTPPIDALAWRGRYPAITSHVTTLENRASFRQTRPSAMAVDIAAEVR